MQTTLLCMPAKAGDVTSTPAGEKATGKCTWPSEANPEQSFPLALHEMTGETGPESSADCQTTLAIFQCQLPQTKEFQKFSAEQPNPGTAAVAIVPELTGNNKTLGRETNIGTAAAGVVDPTSAASKGAGIRNPSNNETVAALPTHSVSASREALPGSINRGETATVDSNVFFETRQWKPAGTTEPRGQIVSASAAGAENGDLVRAPFSRSAGAGSVELEPRDQRRSNQLGVTLLSQGNRSGHPPSNSGGGVQPQMDAILPPQENHPGRLPANNGRSVQPQPLSPSGQPHTGRDPVERLSAHAAAAAGPSTDNDEFTSPKEWATSKRETAGSGGATSVLRDGVDRSASDYTENIPGKKATDLNPRQHTAAASDSRLSVSAPDPQTFLEGHGKLDKPNPTEIIDQIVKKAVIRLRDGHSEVRIDLKPEQLGHLRMQISTENHQVTLRILTEHPLVKEIIESSAAQLKADLLNQGLQMEQLEVGVNGDNDRFGHQPDNPDRSAPGKAEDAHDTASAADHSAEGAPPGSSPTASGSGIDTFV